MEKIEVEAHKGLKIVNVFLKWNALAREAGMKPNILFLKMSRAKNQYGDEYKITEENVDMLNFALPVIGERLQKHLIEYTTDRTKITDQLKLLSKDVDMPYIYRDKLQKKQSWFANRMRPEGSASFTEKDIVKINSIIWEISTYLLNIKLTLN